MNIEVRNLSFGYGSREILKNIGFTVNEGEIIALLGPNGAGKTTLFKCLLGFFKTRQAAVFINGKDIESYSRKELSRFVSYIPQSYHPVYNHTVADTVMMGLTNSLGLLESPSAEHQQKVLDALDSLGILNLADHGSMKISGGERQLMMLARALVQDARLIIMDEPTANLDYGNSFMVMQKVKELCNKGYSILFSTHNPDQAFRYATRTIALKDGKILSDGKPADVLTPQMLGKIYEIDVAVNDIKAGNDNFKVCTPYEQNA